MLTSGNQYPITGNQYVDSVALKGQIGHDTRPLRIANSNHLQAGGAVSYIGIGTGYSHGPGSSRCIDAADDHRLPPVANIGYLKATLAIGQIGFIILHNQMPQQIPGRQ